MRAKGALTGTAMPVRWAGGNNGHRSIERWHQGRDRHSHGSGRSNPQSPLGTPANSAATWDASPKQPVSPDSCRGQQSQHQTKIGTGVRGARFMERPMGIGDIDRVPDDSASSADILLSRRTWRVRHGRSSQSPLGAHARSSHLARCEPNGNPGQRAAQGSHPACWPDGRPRLRSFAPRRYRRSAGPLSAEPMGISRTILL